MDSAYSRPNPSGLQLSYLQLVGHTYGEFLVKNGNTGRVVHGAKD
jgi:hypothetical protein